MIDPAADLVVPRRFRGPRRSGNGGWTAGALAGLVAPGPGRDDGGAGRPAIEVMLLMPPPLDTALTLSASDGVTVASYGGRPVASARVVERALLPAEPVSPEVARRASARYPGLHTHPFPTCFSCGTGRDDGLRIFPGEVDPAARPTVVAATWTPDGSLLDRPGADPDDVTTSLAVAWAALDCAGGWAGDVGERPMVLGRITARIDALPRIGEEHVVVGEARGSEGRKTFAATSLYDADGRLIGTAEQVWLTVDPSAFNALGA